jgi:hypothetical protein
MMPPVGVSAPDPTVTAAERDAALATPAIPPREELPLGPPVLAGRTVAVFCRPVRAAHLRRLVESLGGTGLVAPGNGSLTLIEQHVSAADATVFCADCAGHKHTTLATLTARKRGRPIQVLSASRVAAVRAALVERIAPALAPRPAP